VQVLMTAFLERETLSGIILTTVLCIFYYFVQWTNKCTINWQIITIFLHILTLMCHLQGVHSSDIQHRCLLRPDECELQQLSHR
jgi:hypothetical protein